MRTAAVRMLFGPHWPPVTDQGHEVADTGPTFWFGGPVNDPRSEFGQAGPFGAGSAYCATIIKP